MSRTLEKQLNYVAYPNKLRENTFQLRFVCAFHTIQLCVHSKNYVKTQLNFVLTHSDCMLATLIFQSGLGKKVYVSQIQHCV